MRNLNDVIPGAPNFKYKEFVRSMTAKRKGIDNIPTDENVWKNLENLAVNVLQPLRNKFGRIRILSGYRCPELNVKIGGSATSNHCRGEAADIEPLEEGVELIDLVNYINNNLEFRWIIAEYFPDGWIHVDFRLGGNIKGLKLKNDTYHYAKVSPEFLNKLYA